MTKFFTILGALALLTATVPAFAAEDDGGFGTARFANAAPAALSDDTTTAEAAAIAAVEKNDADLDAAAAELQAIEAAAGEEPSVIVDQVNPLEE